MSPPSAQPFAGSPPAGWRRTALVAGLLVAAVLLVFEPALDAGFVAWDDPLYVTANRTVQQGLTLDGLRWAFTTGHAANWHPLTWLSHMADVELFGLGPRGHHLTSVALHAATAVMALLFVARAGGSLWMGALVAALFAVHPLRVESVAWVAERKDVLCGLFSLAAALAYLGYRERPGWGRYLGVTALVAAALLTKPMAVSLPLLLWLLDFWPAGPRETPAAGPEARAGHRLRLLEKLPWLAMAAGVALATLLAQEEGGGVAGGGELAWSARAANAATALVRYLGLTLWPAGLSVLYPHPFLPGGTPPSMVAVVGASALLLALGAGAARLWRRDRAIAVGGLWFLVSLGPTLGIVQVGEQAMADRYTYLPHVGLFLAVGRLAALALARTPRRWPFAGALAAAVVVVFGVATHRQAQNWQSTARLFESSLAATPENPILLHHLGLDRARAGRLAEAFALQRRAIELRPVYVEAHLALGVVLARQGLLEKAERQLELPLDIRPGWGAAEEAMARVLLAQGKAARAVPHARRALASDPEGPELRALVAFAEAGRARELAAAGNAGEACAAVAAAVAADPLTAGREIARDGDLADLRALCPEPVASPPAEGPPSP